ncbi:MAG: hypothetical protein WC675_01725 [Patescibacteria group bacterium]|jgi:hypothetical protein
MSLKLKTAIIVSLNILLIIVISLVIILPITRDIKKIGDAIYKERVDLEKKYLRGQLLKKTVSDFEKIKPQKDRLNAIFIIEGEELKFVSRLEEIASLNNVRQTIELDTKNSEIQEGIKILPLKITTQGNFVSIMKYLTDLEQLNYYFNIYSVRIGTEKDLIIATLDGKIFSQGKEEIK